MSVFRQYELHTAHLTEAIIWRELTCAKRC
ncbi:hypothetical protein CCHOA_06180 [Corynebacterium choanae]|uniref:Uncharacterized protein n=1 Tax=Corynebacterium choanae TaxID=1862358 RepID=A0A3G6J6B5_9CORY|nr:hypothetical protein CCHOA_06180 [Corynebacterium choanae]